MKIKLYTLFPFLSFLLNVHSQSMQSAEIYESIQKIKETQSVLYIAAHPDDENTRVISYLSKEKKYRVAYLSLTRGDGGQNLIGPEQGIELGAIRSYELMQARKIDGAEQYFTRAYDFGYSKNPEETFNNWEEDSILQDVVWIIRSFKPDVIITRFPTTGEGGHGHHTASAMLAEKAIVAAKDPKAYPHQLQFTSIWNCNTLLWNTFKFGDRNTTAEDQIKINVGTYNPLTGVYTGEIASYSRSKHASQGFGTNPQKGEILEYFKPIISQNKSQNLMQNANTSWEFLIPNKKTRNKILKLFSTIEKNYDFRNPGASLEQLVELKTLLSLHISSENSFWIHKKIELLNQVISQCIGLDIHIHSDKEYLPSGSNHTFKLSYCINPKYSSIIQHLNLTIWGQKLNLVITKSCNDTLINLAIPENQSYSFPYWLHKPVVNNLFAKNTPEKEGKAIQKSLLNYTASYTINFPKTSQISIESTIDYTTLDPSKGLVKNTCFVVPKATIQPLKEKFYLIHSDTGYILEIPLLIQKNDTAEMYTIDVNLPLGFTLLNYKEELSIYKNETEKNVVIRIKTKPSNTPNLQPLSISYKLISENDTQTGYYKKISYEHIPNFLLQYDATSTLYLLNIQKEHIQNIGTIGYIPGSGDKIAEVLKEIGINIEMIDIEKIKNLEELSKFSTILTGIRAYNTNTGIVKTKSIMDQYVLKGGKLVVQYNTENRIGPLLVNPAPDKSLQISRNRVTDEKAPITFINPNHELINQPFKLSSKEFDSWVQERGIYFAAEPNEKNNTGWQAILSMQDPSESPLRGSLVYKDFEKGRVIYTGLALFRQIPNGNEGAIKLLINLIHK